jgi:hypothetical protein
VKAEKEASQMVAVSEREATEKSPEEVDAEDEAKETDVPPPVAAGGTVTLTMEQFMALMNRGSGISVSEIAEAVARATQAGMVAGADRVKPKELKPNETERKSAYNPLGERDHPRPKLKCHMYFGSAPLGSPKEVTTLTHDEVAALNGLTPGHYRVPKTDGSSSIVEVKGQMNANRQLDRLWILLPEGEENKNGYYPLAQFAASCRDENRVQPFVE